MDAHLSLSRITTAEQNRTEQNKTLQIGHFRIRMSRVSSQPPLGVRFSIIPCFSFMHARSTVLLPPRRLAAGLRNCHRLITFISVYSLTLALDSHLNIMIISTHQPRLGLLITLKLLLILSPHALVSKLSITPCDAFSVLPCRL